MPEDTLRNTSNGHFKLATKGAINVLKKEETLEICEEQNIGFPLKNIQLKKTKKQYKHMTNVESFPLFWFLNKHNVHFEIQEVSPLQQKKFSSCKLFMKLFFLTVILLESGFNIEYIILIHEN